MEITTFPVVRRVVCVLRLGRAPRRNLRLPMRPEMACGGRWRGISRSQNERLEFVFVPRLFLCLRDKGGRGLVCGCRNTVHVCRVSVPAILVRDEFYENTHSNFVGNSMFSSHGVRLKASDRERGLRTNPARARLPPWLV